MFLRRNVANYPRIIPVTPSYLELWNSLVETVLLRFHNACFSDEREKIIPVTPFLSGTLSNYMSNSSHLKIYMIYM